MPFKDITAETTAVAQGYHFNKPPAFVESLREVFLKIVRAVMEFFNDLFHRSGGAVDSRSLSTFMQYLVYLAGAVAIIAVCVVLAKRVGDNKRASQQTIRGASEVEEIFDAKGWRTQAVKLAEVHEYKSACRALYLSLLQTLDENGIAKFAPTKTNYEYSYLLAKHPVIQSGFKQLAQVVEVIWFGNKSAETDDYRLSLQKLDELTAEISQVAQEKLQQESLKS